MKESKERVDDKILQGAVRRVLNSRIPDKSLDIEQMLRSNGIGQTGKNAVAMAMMLGAIDGNKGCAEWLKDTLGEKAAGKQKSDQEGAVVFISGEDEIKA